MAREAAALARGERERLTVARRERPCIARAFEAMLQELDEEMRESVPHQLSRTDISDSPGDAAEPVCPMVDGTDPTLAH